MHVYIRFVCVCVAGVKASAGVNEIGEDDTPWCVSKRGHKPRAGDSKSFGGLFGGGMKDVSFCLCGNDL